MRVAGWPRELNLYLTEISNRARTDSFAYGSFDCVHLLGDWVLRCTGVDPLADVRGRYANKEQAETLLAELGGLYAALELRLGAPVHPAMGQRGDAAYRTGDGSCGILFTTGAVMRGIFLSEHGGLVMHRLADIDHVFRV